MPINISPHHTYTQTFNLLLLHFLIWTGALSHLCCLPHFRVKRTSCSWTWGEYYEFMRRARGVSEKQCCMRLTDLPVLHSPAIGVGWIFHFVIVIIYFFSLVKRLITDSGVSLPMWQLACTTAHCQSTPHLFWRQPSPLPFSFALYFFSLHIQ